MRLLTRRTSRPASPFGLSHCVWPACFHEGGPYGWRLEPAGCSWRLLPRSDLLTLRLLGAYGVNG